AGLAGELHTRGVPSLDEALADHRLRPVHAAVGRLLVAMTAADIAARRADLAETLGLDGTKVADAGVTEIAIHAADLDPAARAAVRLRPLDRTTFDSGRIGTAL